jgi:hypothetical protein
MGDELSDYVRRCGRCRTPADVARYEWCDACEKRYGGNNIEVVKSVDLNNANVVGAMS